MTKKLYYTCPIEAAYMAKNFGVKFDFEESWQGVSSPKLLSELIKNKGAHYKPAVSLESHSIFEPQDGDLSEFAHRKTYPYAIVKMNSRHNIEKAQNEVKNIIQRNGKSFIMPEVENA